MKCVLSETNFGRRSITPTRLLLLSPIEHVMEVMNRYRIRNMFLIDMIEDEVIRLVVIVCLVSLVCR